MATRRSKPARSLTADLSLAPALPALLGPVSRWQALLALVAANAFDDLKISVALWVTGDWWYPVHIVEGQGIQSFEYAHGVAARRWAYNSRCFEQVRQKRRIVRGEHSGFCDLFVPLLDEREVRGIFVAGPFATARPSSADVLSRWLEVTGTQGRVTDPAFSAYLSMTLTTLTLESPLLGAFERLMACFADLVAGKGALDALSAEAHVLRKELSQARFAELMWGVAQNLVDDRRAHGFASHAHGEMAAIGIEQVPEHVVAGLLVGRPDETDPIDELLRCDAFQRASASLARKRGNTVCGQIGDHGVAFLVDDRGSRASTRAKLLELSTQAAASARRFGLRLHAGISQQGDAAPLPERYRTALRAADQALSQGQAVVFAEDRPERSAERLRDLRSELAQSVGNRPSLLSPRFARYIDAVLAHSGYRAEPTRAALDAGLERLAEPLLANGSLDRKSFNELCAAMERTSHSTRTVTELVATYRSLVSEIEAALQRPKAARQDRGTRRAIGFIHERLSEPLTLAQVARVAGFAPDYFSKLFKHDQGVTFAHYVQKLRIERAKEMLKGTVLGVDQVQKLCGFRTRTYFHRVFKTASGMTPAEYRGKS